MIEVVSLVLSIIALMATLALAFRQMTISRQSNVLPVLVDLFQEYRSIEFKRHMMYVLTELGSECNPSETGYRHLPEFAAKHVKGVSYFFDNLGILVASKAIDESLVISFVGESAESAWFALEPFIMREREIRKGDYQEYFEHLVALIRSDPPRNVRRRLNLQKLNSTQSTGIL